VRAITLNNRAMEIEPHSKDSLARSFRNQREENAKSPFVDSFRQAGFSGDDKPHGDAYALRGGKISIGLFAFVSGNSDVSYDASFSSTERPTTPAVEPISDESRSESNRPRRRMRPCESKASVLYGMNCGRVNRFGNEFEKDVMSVCAGASARWGCKRREWNI